MGGGQKQKQNKKNPIPNFPPSNSFFMQNSSRDMVVNPNLQFLCSYIALFSIKTTLEGVTSTSTQSAPCFSLARSGWMLPLDGYAQSFSGLTSQWHHTQWITAFSFKQYLYFFLNNTFFRSYPWLCLSPTQHILSIRNSTSNYIQNRTTSPHL